MTPKRTSPRPSAADVERKRAALHQRLAEDPDFLRVSEELRRRILTGARSSESISASELRERLGGRGKL